MFTKFGSLLNLVFSRMSCIFCVKDIVSFSVCGFQGTCADKIKLLAERSKTSFCRPAALRPYLRGDGGIRTLDPLLARQVLSQLSYTPIKSGSHLLSHAVSSIVSSAAWVLTIVFGMGTGVSPRRIATGNLLSFHFHEPS